MSKRDYYEILGLEKGADPSTIKTSYRKLALKYHPDRNQGDAAAEEKFKEASEAYEVLSDPEKRSVYDRFGHSGLSGQGFSGFSDVQDIFSSFGSIFEEFFGGFGGAGGGRHRPRRGADLRYDLDIDFEEGVFGAEKEIKFDRMGSCETCQGSGAKAGSGKKTCQTCGGMGQIRRTQGFFSVATGCHHCGGEGQVIEDPCRPCRGKGVTPSSRTLNVKIPPGVESGIRLRVSGEGEVGSSGGPAGDLYVVLNVLESEHFERDGHDLYVHHPIGIAQAALGCKVKVRTLEDELSLELPAGTQQGHIHTVAGAGVPKLRGLGRGDLHVVFEVTVPKKLNKAQREALQKFAELYGEDETEHSSSGFFQKIFRD